MGLEIAQDNTAATRAVYREFLPAVLYVVFCFPDFGVWVREVPQWLWNEIPLLMVCLGAPEHFSTPNQASGLSKSPAGKSRLLIV